MVKFFVFFSGAALLLTTPLSAYDEDHLERLHDQVNRGIHIRCEGFDLQDADLRGLNLTGADFFGAKLRGANLSKANLQDAIFAEAELQKTNFSCANLLRASFYHANLNKAIFKLANLTSADFTKASANGAKFKGAQLLNAMCENISSAKGSLLQDKPGFSRKLMKEKEVDTIKGKLSKKGSANHIIFKAEDTLQNIHSHLYSTLPRISSSYAIADFRQLFSTANTGPNYIVQDSLNYLKSPIFRHFVREIAPVKDGKVLIVFLNSSKEDAEKKPFFHNRKGMWTLDLHGKVPLPKKKKQIDTFVEESYRHSRGTIEIITGRGLNNPDGIMGTLWGICKNYLSNGNLKAYIQDIHSISKDGGWRISLKPKGHKKTKKQNRVTSKAPLRTKYIISFPSFSKVAVSTSTAFYLSKDFYPGQTKSHKKSKRHHLPTMKDFTSAAPVEFLSKKKKDPALTKPSFSAKKKPAAPAPRLQKKMPPIRVLTVKKAMTTKVGVSYAEAAKTQTTPVPTPPKAKIVVLSKEPPVKQAKAIIPPKKSKKKGASIAAVPLKEQRKPTRPALLVPPPLLCIPKTAPSKIQPPIIELESTSESSEVKAPVAPKAKKVKGSAPKTNLPKARQKKKPSAVKKR